MVSCNWFWIAVLITIIPSLIDSMNTFSASSSQMHLVNTWCISFNFCDTSCGFKANFLAKLTFTSALRSKSYQMLKSKHRFLPICFPYCYLSQLTWHLCFCQNIQSSSSLFWALNAIKPPSVPQRGEHGNFITVVTMVLSIPIAIIIIITIIKLVYRTYFRGTLIANGRS